MRHRENRDPARVRGMFSGVAPRYDLLNHLLSANLDRGWRRTTARTAARAGPARVLDLCGGTGDLAVEVARRARAELVVCCDFCHPMLLQAARKFARKRLRHRCSPLEADGLRLPFGDETFDAVTVGFGIRNFVCLDTGLREIHRVLRPEGRVVVLEFSRPTGRILGGLYRFYLTRVLPRLGEGVSRSRGAYGYLARTITDFPAPTELAGRIRASGFAACEWTMLSGGIVAIHTGHKGR